VAEPAGAVVVPLLVAEAVPDEPAELEQARAVAALVVLDGQPVRVPARGVAAAAVLPLSARVPLG
jgi:hypothetical protein